jgi:hypothetical protein
VPVLKTILCPVNYTDAARAGLEHAASLAARFSARLVAACVLEPGDSRSEIFCNQKATAGSVLIAIRRRK